MSCLASPVCAAQILLGVGQSCGAQLSSWGNTLSCQMSRLTTTITSAGRLGYVQAAQLLAGLTMGMKKKFLLLIVFF